MSVTDGARTLILTSTIATSIDNIDVISVQTISGEIERLEPQNVIVLSATERKYEFYLTEDEGIGTLTIMSLFGNGATITFGTGTEMARQLVNIPKTNTQSLLIYWIVRVI
jgi:hypothetical protein